MGASEAVMHRTDEAIISDAAHRIRLALVGGTAVTEDDLMQVPVEDGFTLAEKPATPQNVATAGQRDTLRLLTIAELQAACKSVAWLCKGVIAADAVSMIFGAPKTFKSFLALDFALHVAHGMQWCGRRTKRGPVVYVAAEGGTGMSRRITAWHKQRKVDAEGAEFLALTVPVQLLTQGGELRAVIEASALRPSLIVVDTMSQTFSGDENSSSDVALWLSQLRVDLQQPFGAAVLVVHHTGHAATERPRGSSAIIGNTDALLAVWREEKSMGCTLANITQKDGELAPDMSFSLATIEVGKDEDGDTITSLAAVALVTAEAAVDHVKAEERKGRGSSHSRFLAAAKHGQLETLAREEFYRQMADDTAEAKKKAWQRAMKWALDNRVIDLSEGKIIVMAPNA
jgi:hypothetical protein